jgi:hypothetical protein
MARKVDPALTKRAIGWVRRARARASTADEGISGWEDEFLASVEERLERYGSAFCDPDKGQLSAPLSLRQGLKLRQIGRKGADRRAASRSLGDQAQGDETGGDAPPDPSESPAQARRAPARTGQKPLKRGKPLRSRAFRRRKPAPTTAPDET